MNLRVVVAVCALLVFAPVVRAEEPKPEEAAKLLVTVEPEQAVVGQPVLVTLRIEYDDVFFEEHAATLFRRPLDVEMQVTAPWLGKLEGAVHPEEDLGPPGEIVTEPQRIALNGAPEALYGLMQEERAGAWNPTVLVKQVRIVPTKAGPLTLAAPTLRYAYAARIEENLMGERTGIDTRTVDIAGTATVIEVVEPPAAGRPASFGGAVGRFDVETRVASRAVTFNEPFVLELVLTGEGNLGLIEQPALGLDPDAFHVYGATEEAPDGPLPSRRVIRYEIAVTRGGVDEIPSIAFSYYEPGTGYRTARSRAIRLEVSGAPRDTPTETARSATAWRPERPGAATAFVVLAVLAAVAFMALAIAVLWRRRPRRQPASASTGSSAAVAAAVDGTAQRTASAAALRAALDGPLDDRMQAYAAFLAAHLDCGPGAVVGAGLRARLAAAGIDAALTERACAAMDALVDARYGGDADVRVLDAALVDELAAALAA